MIHPDVIEELTNLLGKHPRLVAQELAPTMSNAQIAEKLELPARTVMNWCRGFRPTHAPEETPFKPPTPAAQCRALFKQGVPIERLCIEFGAPRSQVLQWTRRVRPPLIQRLKEYTAPDGTPVREWLEREGIDWISGGHVVERLRIGWSWERATTQRPKQRKELDACTGRPVESGQSQ